MNNAMRVRIADLLSTWFGCGFAPKAPGTVGSAAAVLIAAALHYGAGFTRWHFGLLALVSFFPAVWAAGVTAQARKLKDPQIVVIDEVIGQWLSLAGAATLSWKAWLAAFLLFRTFDILRRDAEGFYYFIERSGDSYRFRGENVSAALVERELLATPGVLEAVATGVEIAGYDGRAGLAVVVPAAGFDVAALERLSDCLPRSALPRFVRLVPALSRTASLKLLRRAWSQEGVDPARVSGELWLLDAGKYRRLDSEAYRDVVSGKLRL